MDGPSSRKQRARFRPAQERGYRNDHGPCHHVGLAVHAPNPDVLEHELRTHGSARRELARQLVGTPDAEDLLQDTTLQALRRPPACPTGLLPWLSRVLRFRASKLGRGEQRRREGALASAETSASPLGPAARMEAMDRLHRALRQLSAPYGRTLRLRFFGSSTS